MCAAGRRDTKIEIRGTNLKDTKIEILLEIKWQQTHFQTIADFSVLLQTRYFAKMEMWQMTHSDTGSTEDSLCWAVWLSPFDCMGCRIRQDWDYIDFPRPGFMVVEPMWIGFDCGAGVA